MANELYDLSIPVLIRHLNGLAACMKKAQTAYAEKKCDEKTPLCYRLYPDMFDFTRQVQLATDHRGIFGALVSGVDAPKYEDNERSLVDLIGRCEKTSVGRLACGWRNSPSIVNFRRSFTICSSTCRS